MAVLKPNIAKLVAKERSVKAAVKTEADARAALARSLLAQHRSAGKARIRVKRRGPDVLVGLEDPAAYSIEFGRRAGGRGGAMQGLYIMTRTASRR
ncbi:DUF5403 family protein [Kitasatospora indigofera]|uniref:DUF5403 family protein n=1 Tax=Kitasatospora indigofera TaxID=67307 RepID=UPI00368F19F8